MGITLNKVNLEIDGKIYELYKLSFGFNRKLVEVQSNMNKINNQIAKKYEIDVNTITEDPKVSDEDKLEVAKAGLELQDALAGLFVNPEEAKVLDNFDGTNIGQLIEALK